MPASEEYLYDFVIAGFICIAFSLVIILSLGANIAINPRWSRSYPLISIYFASITLIFAKLYVLLGTVDNGRQSNDYYSALYLYLGYNRKLRVWRCCSRIESRFVAAAEALIGYSALAFLAALLFLTMQRGVRAPLKASDKRRRALLAEPLSMSPSSVRYSQPKS